MDELEVHLHPKWQLLYAEIIICLVQQGTHVIVTTHSPYILEALELYSKRLPTEVVQYYYASVDNGTVFENVTSHLDFIYQHFKKLDFLSSLDEVSHQTCASNGKVYVNLDGFFKLGDKNKSCDALFFNLKEKHLLLVEFKRLNLFEEAEEERQFFKRLKPDIYLKMSESLLVLSHYFSNELNISHDDFFKISKSFLLVYKPEDNKELVRKNLYAKVGINRNKYLFKNIKSLNSRTFEATVLPVVV